jgi:hypothetical protein
MSYFRRYREGEHRQVWQELVAKRLFTVEAEDVAYLTMTRVAENFEILIERLGNCGFVFRDFGGFFQDSSDDWVGLEPTRTQPDGAVSDRIKKLQSRFYSIPLSLRAFWEQVGGVNLIGYHPDWNLEISQLDPFFSSALTDDYTDYLRNGLHLELSPDALVKADISGGEGYYLKSERVPDGILENEWQGLLFVEYLRSVFRWGGFPGMARFGPRDLSHLTSGLLDF